MKWLEVKSVLAEVVDWLCLLGIVAIPIILMLIF
jgi:hypothetical protein